jgi:hypothetical protein
MIKITYPFQNLLHVRNILENQLPDILNSLTFTCWLPAFLVEASNVAYGTNAQCGQQREGQRIKTWNRKSRHITLPHSVNGVYLSCCQQCMLQKDF